MSDPRRSSVAVGGLCWLACGAVLLCASAQALPAQTAAELRHRLEEVRASGALADSSWKLAVRTAAARRTEHVVAGGRRVAYDPDLFLESDRVRLGEGLERGRARLIERFGGESALLLDTTAWFVAPGPRWIGFPAVIDLRTSVGADRVVMSLGSPIDPEEVERFVLQVAGQAIPALAPALDRFAGSDLGLAPTESRFAMAGREMAISWAATGRRCATGSVAACRAVLTPQSGSEPLSLHFEPEDWRAVVTAGRMPAVGDSAFFAFRRACLAGNDRDCATIVGKVGVPDPFSSGLRATFVLHAIELGGRDALGQIRRAAEADPNALLAAVAGVPPDSLIASWQRRTAQALEDERQSLVPVTLSVAGWSLLLLVGASRRKPR